MAFFTTDQDLRDCLPPAAASFELADMTQALRLAQQRELAPLLGQAFMEAQEATPTAGLLPYIRQVLATFALALHAPYGALLLSPSGLHTSSTEQKKSATAPQVAALVAQATEDGGVAAEALLAYLEAHLADFPTWASSAACTVQLGEYVANADHLNEHYYIERSRRRFLALVPALKRHDRLAIRPLLGLPMEAELKGQAKAGTLTADNKRLLEDYVRPALVHLAAAEESSTHKPMAEVYMAELKRFLYANADSYATWKADTTVYQPDQPERYTNPEEGAFYAFV